MGKKKIYNPKQSAIPQTIRPIPTLVNPYSAKVGEPLEWNIMAEITNPDNNNIPPTPSKTTPLLLRFS
jgi:hypothetical protein